MKNTYGRNTDVNTTAEQFKLITDKKDEPDYKAVSKFVGGMVECVCSFRMEIYYYSMKRVS